MLTEGRACRGQGPLGRRWRSGGWRWPLALSLVLAALLAGWGPTHAEAPSDSLLAPPSAAAAGAPTDSSLAAAEGGAGSSQSTSGLSLRHPLDERQIRILADGATFSQHDRVILKAEVLDAAGSPVQGARVHFERLTPHPAKLGASDSDRRGQAAFAYTVESLGERITILASLPGSSGEEGRIVFNLRSRHSAWVLFMLFGLAGGLGLFLLGMDMMSSALKRTAGGRMRAILGALTRNRIIGVALGAFVTMVIQSSSATTVMLVSFVQAGLMSFAQTLGVILGADIGTTVTTQLIAFNLSDYALLMIGLGFALRLAGKRRTLRSIGDILLGFGVLFFGMGVMSRAMEPLRSYAPFLGMLESLENPLAGILVGTLFTALIQSSSAFTGIVIVLAQQGILTLDAGIPLIFGANIGTCITALLASLGMGREAKRVALGHVLFKVMGVLLFVAWIPAFAELVRSISPGSDVVAGDQKLLARVVPRQIANAHTLFNVGLALLFLPFTGLAARFIDWLLPDKVEAPPVGRYKPRFLDAGMLQTPALALNLAKVEILHMGERVKLMTEKILRPFLERDLAILDELHEMEVEVDVLDEQITAYLIDIGKQDIGEERTEEVYLMMHVTKQFEHIADIVDKELRPLARQRILQSVDFSLSGRQEVEAYHLKAVKQIARGLDAFRDDSLAKAKRMTKKQAKYVALEGTYRQAHFERVRSAVSETLASSEIHLDLMDGMRKINSYSANIARAMLAQEKSAPGEGE